jgi:hypothetical protein
VSALENKTVRINNDNFKGLSQLSEEFGFRGLLAQLSVFRNSGEFKEELTMKDVEARTRLAALEDRMLRHDREIGVLRSQLSGELESARRQASEAQNEVSMIRSDITQLRELFGEVRELAESSRMIALASQAGLEEIQRKAGLEAECLALKNVNTVKIEVDSLILSEFDSQRSEPTTFSDFPEVFSEFDGKRFSLLWRGSRDGFGGADFHSRCDGHANTLTLILDTKGNIFGGFTPVEWESRDDNDDPITRMRRRAPGRFDPSQEPCLKGDPSMKSFLFTLKNPHNIPARRFGLTSLGRDMAIHCDRCHGPWFYGGISACNNCNTSDDNCSWLDGEYINDTGMNGSDVFAGSQCFRVNEIEVFEITA